MHIIRPYHAHILLLYMHQVYAIIVSIIIIYFCLLGVIDILYYFVLE